MIQKVESLMVAEHILNLVQNDPRAREVGCFVECYQNGREQGFLLWNAFASNNKAMGIYICQDRKSDYIMVYVGEYSMQGISDDAYHHPNSFSPGSSLSAADFVLEQAIKLFYVKK